LESYISLLILYGLQKINGERTPYSIFHLLKGKKSSQTIQDSHLFQISNLFQTFPQLERLYYDELILTLTKEGYIKKNEGEKYLVTNKGLNFVRDGLNKLPIPPYVNGWKYHAIQEDFWKRLSLLIQVCSNLMNYENSYIPIHNDMRASDWLKTTLLKLSLNREVLAEELLKELNSCFSKKDNIKPEVVVLRLTGYKQIGMTPNQAAEMLNMDVGYFQLEFLNTLHFLIENIESHLNAYPILKNLLDDVQKPIVLTKSSLLTYQYLHLGYSLDEIAVVRNLKVNTIEDHVVEVALNDSSFSIDPFVDIEYERQIRQAIHKLSTKQLKMIRQELDGKVTYFQIRLVLAKIGEQL
jgi:uncharacterized protein YpbB